jgi:dTDP-glucose 4,6-dehydratase
MPGSEVAGAVLARRLPQGDIDQMVEAGRSVFERLHGSRIFVTGGTGFVGRWLLEGLLAANERLGLDVRIVMLTRDPAAFARNVPHLAADPMVELVGGDVRTFEFPRGKFDRVVHMAAETNVSLLNPDPEVYLDVIVGGTQRVLDFAQQAEATSLMLVSSGAVYGTQPPTVEHLSEDDPYAPLPTQTGSAYGEAKRCAELLTYARAERIGLSVAVGRCFAFVGPHLPIDSGFAVGNFIRDALESGQIEVKGDGTPRRTYMYAADMATWLWTVAVLGVTGRPYNVGSDESVTIGELARLVAALVGDDVRVKIMGEGGRVGVGRSYIPDISRAKTELGLTLTVGLQEALARTVGWHRRAGDDGQAGPLQ